jgi:hypothetical protein
MWRSSVWATLAVGLLAFCADAPGAADGPALHYLSPLDQLQSAFQRDAGKPRVILLLSPT